MLLYGNNKFLTDESQNLLNLANSFENGKFDSSLPIRRHISIICMEFFWEASAGHLPLFKRILEKAGKGADQ